MVTGMLGVISLAIFATFNNGFKIWKRINQPLADEDLGFLFDKLAVDLNNCLKSNSISFSGSENNLSVPTLVDSPDLAARTVGAVVYSYDQPAGLLIRQPNDFSQLYRHHEDSGVVLLKNIRSLKFEYYYYDKLKSEYIWKEEWSQAGLPLAVRVSLNLRDASENDKIIRTFNIPIGG